VPTWTGSAVARPLRAATEDQLLEVRRAMWDLKAARSRLRFAHAFKAAAYISRAIKSAEGAERHIIRALNEADRG
jgi:hypothetical protein